jgi:putative ABC transport system permease protein
MILVRSSRVLASLIVPARHREFVLGDLNELHITWLRQGGGTIAGLRYLRGVLASAVALRMRRGPSRLLQARNGRGDRRAGALIDDSREAVRGLLRRPRYVVLVTLTLGLGVGSAGAVFGIVNQLLLRPLPGLGDTSRSAFMKLISQENPNRYMGLGGPDVDALRRSASLLDGYATFGNLSVITSVGDSRPVSTRTNSVYGDYFEVLGVRPLLGRMLRADETGPDADPTLAVISERFWRRYFAADPDAVGRQFNANGHSQRVLGVAGGGFAGASRSSEIDLWVPISAIMTLANFPREILWTRNSTGNSDFIVRLKTNVTVADAEEQLNVILANIVRPDPEHAEYLDDLRVALFPGLHTVPMMRESTYRMLAVLAGTVGLVLLIACANVANLLLVRGLRATGETAVRRALGASTWRVTRQWMTESLWLGVLGSAAGLMIAWVIGLSIKGEALARLPEFEGVVLDARVLAFAISIAVLTSLLFGAVPAALAGRFDLEGALRGNTTRATQRTTLLRHGLSAVQLGLSLTLLIGSLLLGRTVYNTYAVDSGLDLEGVSAITLNTRLLGYEPEALDVLYNEVLQVAQLTPGVGTTALDMVGPFSSRFSGRIKLPEGEIEGVRMTWVTPEWFELFAVDAIEGRTLRPEDESGSGSVGVVITAPLATRLFGASGAVGQRLAAGPRADIDAVVVGVVDNLRISHPQLPPDEVVFMPFPPPFPVALTILSRTDGFESTAALQQAIGTVVPGLPLPAAELVTDRIDFLLGEQRIVTRLLGILSAIAVLLAAVGLYGSIAFSVSARMREFGVRLALGADGWRIVRLVARTAAVIVGTGTVLGLGGAFVLSRAIESRLFGVTAVDFTTYAAATALFAGIALLACWTPAVAAVAVDPVRTLRQE